MKKITRLVAVMLVLILGLSSLTACGKAKGTKVQVVDIELTEEQYAFGVDKNQPELLTKTNEFIEKIMKNGTFEAICNKYFGNGTPTAVKSAVLDDKKDQLVVATNAAFEPFEYTEGSNYYGIDMEIAALLAKYLGKELVINNMDFDAVVLSVGQQKCDIAMAGLTVNDDRKTYVNFTTSYYSASQKIIVKEDDKRFADCKTADDVQAVLEKYTKSTKVGVQNGTTGEFFCKGDEDWGFKGFAFTTVGYKNGSLAVQDLINGNLDFVIIDAAPAAAITEAINKLQ